MQVLFGTLSAGCQLGWRPLRNDVEFARTCRLRA